MKKVWGISASMVGTIAVVASVAGCGSTQNDTNASGTGNPSTTTASTGSSSQPVTITFWYGVGDTLSTDIQQMVSEFNKTHPNIKVVATYQGSYSGGGEEQQKLLAAIKAGDPPDIAQIEVHAMPLFASSGQLADLSPLMQQSSVDKPSNFLDGMLVSTQFNGDYYGVPFNRSVPVFYYNKTLFQKAGISNPPATWDELVADAKKLTSGSGSNKVYGFEPLVDWWPWEYAVMSGGGSILSSDNSKATFDTAAATNILSKEQELVKGGYSNVETGPQYWDLMTQDFIHGKAAMDIDSIGSAGEVSSGIGNKFDWGTAILPKDKTLAVPPGGGDVAIMNGISDAKKQAAWQFIQWWTSPKQAAQWSMLTGYLPVQKAAVQESDYQAFLKKNPQFNTALAELKYQKASPASPQYLSVLQTVQQGLQGIFDEGNSVTDTMKQMAQQADSELNG
ncbi:ABC transporter substrate-binding protein [Alicyclobacillus suci]|uniref:ABC transporter substrate-binding protein n=1 Tax=Alicyclobacillus suci TaxID=2816080 RepID=UPI001A8C18BA|nr:ABC transporter substrate-binding protein [Alicyclobacillus suci]